MSLQDKGVDFIAYDDSGRAVLLAEVKSKVGTSEQWAARFRHNMLAHGVLPSAMFFLIATPERMYFWRQNRPSGLDELPGFTMEATNELEKYLGSQPNTIRTPTGQALELAVSAWLTDIARSGAARAKQDPSMRWLADSGFIDSLRTARFEMSPA